MKQSTIWLGLHNEVASLDRQSTIVKLVTLSLGTLLLEINSDVTLLLLLTLGAWLIEAFCKTYQSRAMERLVWMEEQNNPSPVSVYKHYENSDKGLKGKVGEYVTSAMKPTVIGFYGFLLVAIFFIS